MFPGESIAAFSVRRPQAIVAFVVGATLFFILLAGLPTLAPDTFSFLPPATIDTAPDSLLPTNEPVLKFHYEMRKEVSLYSMVVVGVVNETHPNGVFNSESLRRIYELTDYAKTLNWPDPKNPEQTVGVVASEIIAPSTMESIEPSRPGTVKFSWLMPSPPANDEQALAVQRKAERMHFLRGTLISKDGKAICLYLPVTSREQCHRVTASLREKISQFTGDDKFYISGLPVAKELFGKEMVKQAAISVPVTAGVLFLLLLYFVRSPLLACAPMIVAACSVATTMALLIISRQTINITSSMIPIIVMPIAVLGPTHILSRFSEIYPSARNRKTAILHALDELYTPMLYMAIIIATSFLSLAIIPIPALRVFGVFVALGTTAAWACTVTFMPAYMMLIPQRRLPHLDANYAKKKLYPTAFLTRFIGLFGKQSGSLAKWMAFIALIPILIAFAGIGKIDINDNPIRWFAPSHPIREADRVLNRHFAGTYMAYLTLGSAEAKGSAAEYVADIVSALQTQAEQLRKEIPEAPAVFEELRLRAREFATRDKSKERLLEELDAYVQERYHSDFARFDAWQKAALLFNDLKIPDEIFKSPETIAYVARLQDHLLASGIVGKSNSIADIVKTIHRELNSGTEKDEIIPASRREIARDLSQYGNSDRPYDLWHFVTPDYSKAVIWVQLTSGDNRDMESLVHEVDRFIANNPPSKPLLHNWFGGTYINVVWQNKIVIGMLQSFVAAILTAFLVATLLYRSIIWGLLCITPLTLTMALSYGVIGLIGWHCDLTLVMLSTLSLALTMDCAAHFLSRKKQLPDSRESATAKPVSPHWEPATSILNNTVIVGIGFLPLITTRLIPYQTIGILVPAMLILAMLFTLLFLPSLLVQSHRWLFPHTIRRSFFSNLLTYVGSSALFITISAIHFHQFKGTHWMTLTKIGLMLVTAPSIVCLAACLHQKHKDALAGKFGRKR